MEAGESRLFACRGSRKACFPDDTYSQKVPAAKRHGSIANSLQGPLRQGVREKHAMRANPSNQKFTPTFTPNAENVGRNFLPYLRTTHSPSTSEPCLSITPAAFSFAILFQIARSETPIIIASSAAVTWELSRIA